MAQQRGSEYTILQAELCETSDFHGQVRACEMLSPVSRWSLKLSCGPSPRLRTSQLVYTEVPSQSSASDLFFHNIIPPLWVMCVTLAYGSHPERPQAPSGHCPCCSFVSPGPASCSPDPFSAPRLRSCSEAAASAGSSPAVPLYLGGQPKSSSPTAAAWQNLTPCKQTRRGIVSVHLVAETWH